MSRILAIESSHDACSVALWIDGQVKELFEEASRSHAQRLLPMVDSILADAQFSLSALDAIAFSRGPGSFTGLRIAAGITQGLAFGADLPVIPVSTLETLALALNPSDPRYCAVAIDARMDEVYFASYIVSPSGLIEIEHETLMAVDQLCLPGEHHCQQAIKQLHDTAGATLTSLQQHWHCIGTGWQLLPQSQCPWLLNPEVASLELSLNQPRAEYVARLASHLWTAGRVASVEDAQPVYLRGTAGWKKRDQQ